MADKPEFVDMISEATRQNRRSFTPRIIEPEVKEKSRLGHWPPRRWTQLAAGDVPAMEVKPWKTERLELKPTVRKPNPRKNGTGRA